MQCNEKKRHKKERASEFDNLNIQNPSQLALQAMSTEYINIINL